ncbi:anthranilate phosphoribosyltransferase [Actinokineospora sp. G85]|uniref:anthranilate phosphoribosyltransferase n=1 Tax=Actinokineospora sp. G85 TaxID=3406626 RepID=UPI003C741699
MENLDEGWKEILRAVAARRDLSAAQARWAMDAVMAGAADPARLGGLLVGLRAKGETVAELHGLVAGMAAHAVPVSVDGPVLDIVGTGGDGANTVNISTMSAVVAAAAGARVVKHGGRSASSRCGSADLLAELGVVIDLPAPAVSVVLAEVGIAFCFAPVFHPAMRHAGPVRRALGVPTVFNLLGPLTNPAAPAALAVGVADAAMAPLVAGVLAGHGVSALVFRGDDGLDELSVSTTSRVWSVLGGEVVESVFDPQEVGVGLSEVDALGGGDPAHNAAVARRLFAGERGPVRDAVLLSAAAGLAAAAARPGSPVERIGAHLPTVAAALDDGRAASLVERWARTTGKVAEAG